MAAIHNFFWFLVVIGVMILVHELGHFWAARFFDVRVDVFSFGFGTRLLGFRRGETDYRISAIPFGGYVKMAGEQPGEDVSDDPRAFVNKPRWQRMIVAFAGPLMNVALSIAILAGLAMFNHQKVVQEGPSVIGHIELNSPAAKAGVEKGDVVVSMNGEKDPSWEDIGFKTFQSPYKTLNLTLRRNGQDVTAHVTPVFNEREGGGDAGWEEDGPIQAYSVSPDMPAAKAGIQNGDLLTAIDGRPIRSRYTLLDAIKQGAGKPVTLEVQRKDQRLTFTVAPVFNKSEATPRWMIGIAPELKRNIITTRLSLVPALAESVRENGKRAYLIVSFLQGMVERRLPAKSMLQGPIGIAQQSGQAAREGPIMFLLLMDMVSLNLAIFNLLPIPVLDGGMILLLAIEMIMGRDVSLAAKENILKVGFVFLMMVVVFVLYNDISKLIPG
ncbi:MAG: putative rane-associated zinc metalloprotease [Bryobacterales bacterium]|nr:putative rane-associated zinc metalloprotease [Bryobacterales bacterium]